MSKTNKLLNVGCGGHYHGDWVNIDINPGSPDVINFDIKAGIPFSDNEFDAVYSSHMLEHLSKPDGVSFLKEMYRVLKPGGIIRIVVPDLEQICRLYLEKLDIARSGNSQADADYEWMKLELLDQVARDVGGGDMLCYLIKKDLSNKEFIVSRIGQEARNIWARKEIIPNTTSKIDEIKDSISKLRASIKLFLLRMIAGQDADATMAIGRFRLSGETHKFMYDEYSCRMTLLEAGFTSPEKMGAVKSKIEEYEQYHLDSLEDGSVRKPDSLFVEAIK